MWYHKTGMSVPCFPELRFYRSGIFNVPVTFADTEPLERDYGFKPNTSLRDGLRKFAEWYKEFYL